MTQAEPTPSETPTPPTGRATGTNKLASTLTSIGPSAFQGTGLENIDLSETGITGLGSNTSNTGYLGNGVFQDAVSLSSVTLPNGLQAIPAATFAGTTSLKSIDIPSTVNRINAGNDNVKGAFQGSGLTSIDLSGTGITGLTSANQNGSWPNADGENNRGTFSYMPELTTVTLPAGLTGIPKDAFANSTKLATVKFGDASASNPSARDGNENAITLPKGLTSLNQNAFTGAAATTVDLSKAIGLTTIDNYVFKDMPNLTTVTLPSGLTTINDSAFQNDAVLKTLSQAIPAAADSSNAQARAAEGIAKFGSKLISIGQAAFQGTGFSTVDLSAATGTSASAGTTPLSVGSGAFTNMASLETVKLPKDSNINPAYFGNPADAAEPKLKTIQYGKENSSPATFKGNGNTFSGANYNKISNETIDLIGYASLTTLGAGVLFGNTAMKTLKMNAPIMSLNNTTVSVADPVWQLGAVPTAGATNTDAAYATAAIGGNSALTNIEFGNFKKKNTSSNQFDNITQFSEITSDTWTQVSKLMNMFAKYDTTSGSPSVTNLAQWTVSTGETGVIQTDIADRALNGGTDTDKKWTVSGQPKVIAESDTSATLTHNGVTWTYTKASSSSDNSITISGTVNIYKSKNGTNGYYQTYFGTTDSGDKAKPKDVTVKITLVPNTLPASSLKPLKNN